jgi:hypothetical protein
MYVTFGSFIHTLIRIVKPGCADNEGDSLLESTPNLAGIMGGF